MMQQQPYDEAMDQRRQQQQQWFIGGSPAHDPTYLPPPSPQWQQQQQTSRFIGPLLPQQQQQQQQQQGTAEPSQAAGSWQHGVAKHQQQQQQQIQQQQGHGAAAAAGGGIMSPERVFSGQLVSSPLSIGLSPPQAMLLTSINSPAAAAAGAGSSGAQQRQQQQEARRSSAPIDLPMREDTHNPAVDDIMESDNMSWRPGTSLGLNLTGFNRTNSMEGPLPLLQSPQVPPPLALPLPPLPWQQQQQGEVAAAAAQVDRSLFQERTNSFSSLVPGSPVMFGNAAAAGSSRGASGLSNLAAVLLHQHSGQQQQQQLPRRPATAGGGTPITVVPYAATGTAAAAAAAAATPGSIGIDALLGPAAAATAATAAVDPSDLGLLLPVTSGLRRGGSIRSYSFSGGESLSPASAAAAAATVAAAAAAAGGDGGSGSSRLGAFGSSLWQQQQQGKPPSGSAPNSYQAPSMMIPVTNISNGRGSDGSPSPTAAAAAAVGSSRLGKGVSCPSSTVNLSDHDHWQQQQQQQQQQRYGPSRTGGVADGIAATGSSARGAAVAAAVPGTLPWQLQEPVFDLPPFSGTMDDAGVPEGFGAAAAAGAGAGAGAGGDDINMEEEQQQQQYVDGEPQHVSAVNEDTDMQEQQHEWQRRRSSITDTKAAATAAAATAAAAAAAADQIMDDDAADTRSPPPAAAAETSDDEQLQQMLHQMQSAAAAAEALDVCLNCTAPLLIDFDDDADDLNILQSNNNNNNNSIQLGMDGMVGIANGQPAAAGSDQLKRGRISSSVVCFSCRHRQSDDRALMTGQLPKKLATSAAGATRGCILQPSVAAGNKARPLLAFDAGLLSHAPPCDSSHPERPERAAAVVSRLMATGLAQQCKRIPCRAARVDELAAVHDIQLIREVQMASKLQQQEAAAAAAAEQQSPNSHRPPASPDADRDMSSPQQQQQLAAAQDTAAGISHGSELGASHILDCYIGPATFDCAAMAAGGAIDVAVAVVQGSAPCGAAIIRPPGHHAEGGLSMGFCYFNNAAVAARAAQSAGAGKVLILDWDVHHGNGTQAIFESDPSVMYMSIHRYDFGSFFPGTGHVEDVGLGAAAGSSVNVPWDSAGPGDADYMAAFTRVLLLIAYEFAPDLIIVSAGFDAAHGDPLGGCHVTPACYGHMTALLQPIAPLVLLLEGGYNLAATAASVEACVRVMLGQPPARMQTPLVPTRVGLTAIQNAVAVQSRYWRCLGGGMPGTPASLITQQHQQQQQQHHHSKAVGQHPTHVQQQQQQQQHAVEQDADAVWRINSVPPPGGGSSSSSRLQQQHRQLLDVQRTATPALGMPAPASNGFQLPQQQQQQQQVATAAEPAATAAAAAAAGSSDLLDPFALQAGWSFSETSHPVNISRLPQQAPAIAAAAGDEGDEQQQQQSGSGVGDSLLLAQLRRQLQSEGGPSLEMPLSAAPTLSSTFSL